MSDEIIKELWKIKDDIASEYSNDVEAFVQYLRTKYKKQTNEITNLKEFKDRLGQQHSSILQQDNVT